ncbi:TRAP transporter substrate-binding protein [Pseudooceanicola sediminis]|uniref:TRAP transporter substrate-binding protein n=1 Tax=Pseudooceanicola sediminis TaxID=2211117 RepID=A0A399IV76_9RHOB|nr:TRAP transporter substrate-binding protein [Pseudooceanicola sediminis]KAA2311575.1 TRAP transporter substrate-binding protein [Puniceibacterium sp. HSS470]RII37055.1 TRAP transporter substrate-binding protein [Pseudooceanicola sediminis]|tara:strand:+ start:28757 stop:29749 length:993 start_codon:yes stop_codon:yes gene_type:complete
MKLHVLCTAGLFALALTTSVQAQSIAVALDATPDRDTQGSYRYVDNLLTALKAEGWETETFPRDSLGGEDDRLDQVRSGILDVSMSNYAMSYQFVPEMRVMQLPYTFDSSQHVHKFFDESDYLDTVNEKLAAEGMHILAVVPTGGMLGIFNNQKEVRSVKDMEGLRMRALDANQLEMFKMMGASGVVIPFSEVPNALQTGIANGYVNASVVPLAFGQADLFSNFTDARVIISARIALASSAWWDGLSDAEKAQVNAASEAALEDVYAWVDATQETSKADLEMAGIAVYEPTAEELATFKSATDGMGELLTDVDAARITELRDMVGDYAPD